MYFVRKLADVSIELPVAEALEVLVLQIFEKVFVSLIEERFVVLLEPVEATEACIEHSEQESDTFVLVGHNFLI